MQAEDSGKKVVALVRLVAALEAGDVRGAEKAVRDLEDLGFAWAPLPRARAGFRNNAGARREGSEKK